MGGITSKNFQDLLDENSEDGQHDKARTLPPNLDPRSPSSDICRTPIQVEATPKPMVDPRSPTIGIDRTPIYGCKPSNRIFDTTPLKIGQTEDAAPETGDDTSEDPADIVQPIFDESQGSEGLERSASEPDLSIVDDDALLIRQRTAVISKSFKESIKPKPMKVLYSHTNMTAEISPCKGNNKVTPPRSPLKVISDGSRSPLSTRNIDVNSPRNIVHRKQITKIAKMKSQGNSNKGNKSYKNSPSKYKIFHDDKENLDSN